MALCGGGWNPKYSAGGGRRWEVEQGKALLGKCMQILESKETQCLKGNLIYIFPLDLFSNLCLAAESQATRQVLPSRSKEVRSFLKELAVLLEFQGGKGGAGSCRGKPLCPDG